MEALVRTESKNKNWGRIVSTIVHIILIALLFYNWDALKYQDPPPGLAGTEISFGEPELGMNSEEAPLGETMEEEEEEPVEEEPVEEEVEPVEEEVIEEPKVEPEPKEETSKVDKIKVDPNEQARIAAKKKRDQEERERKVRWRIEKEATKETKQY